MRGSKYTSSTYQCPLALGDGQNSVMMQRVFVDANVLFSRTLYDWLFWLRIKSSGELFRLHTSWDVINEAGARLRDEHPEWGGQGISSLMSKITEIFDEIIEEFPGGNVGGISDAGDWHVHHAAEASRADILLTQDSGFSSDLTHYEVYSCDEFFVEVNKSAPRVVQEVIEIQAPYWAKRGGKQLPDALREASCPEFAEIVLKRIRKMAVTTK